MSISKEILDSPLIFGKKVGLTPKNKIQGDGTTKDVKKVSFEEKKLRRSAGFEPGSAKGLTK